MTRTLALAFVAFWGAAHAADPATWPEWPPPPQWAESRPFGAGPRIIERASFAALDLDRDFSLSRDEAAASPAVEGNFAAFDLDGDARLAPIEFNNLALTLALR
jgi:hypothetical protein